MMATCRRLLLLLELTDAEREKKLFLAAGAASGDGDATLKLRRPSPMKPRLCVFFFISFFFSVNAFFFSVRLYFGKAYHELETKLLGTRKSSGFLVLQIQPKMTLHESNWRSNVVWGKDNEVVWNKIDAKRRKINVKNKTWKKKNYAIRNNSQTFFFFIIFHFFFIYSFFFFFSFSITMLLVAYVSILSCRKIINNSNILQVSYVVMNIKISIKLFGVTLYTIK